LLGLQAILLLSTKIVVKRIIKLPWGLDNELLYNRYICGNSTYGCVYESNAYWGEWVKWPLRLDPNYPLVIIPGSAFKATELLGMPIARVEVLADETEHFRIEEFSRFVLVS
jgi:hypothetical protein